MRSRLLQLCLAMLVLSALLSQSVAQDKDKPKKPGAPRARTGDKDEDDYRRFFKKPTTTPEYWNAMHFEIEVGRYDLAAVHLRNWLNIKPGDEDLVKLADDVGVAAFLKLRNIRRWSDDP